MAIFRVMSDLSLIKITKTFYQAKFNLHSNQYCLFDIKCAGVQAVEDCSTDQTATVQTGTACEDCDAEAEGVITQPSSVMLPMHAFQHPS
ncbi:hypothetical protein [Gimesia sp.]|uniref:hypothetical protein n=1 Tax=Gimesia sp. TaxID=2024833 RepID=UPI003A93BD0A